MSHGFIAHGVDGICRPLILSGGGGGGGGNAGGVITITASVGIKGMNRADDVRVIQQALNDVPADQGRPKPLLVVDGISGPKTENGIQMFQLKHFGWPGADGRVDPDGVTIAKLNELSGGVSASPFDLGTAQAAAASPGRIARVAGLLGQSLRCIKAAQQNLLSAQTVVDTVDAPNTLPSFSRSARMMLVNRHFDVDTYPKPQRRKVIGQILRTFDTMLSVFARPGGLWGMASFDLDPLAKPYVAYTYRQGFHNPGRSQTEKGKKIRTDAIYLCEKMDTKTDEVVTNVIVHELAHFVGRPHITDFAYGWFDDAKMARLVPWQKLHNAMNHNNFAFDALHGRKPVGL
jgi:hypothetical protein